MFTASCLEMRGHALICRFQFSVETMSSPPARYVPEKGAGVECWELRK